MTNQTRGRSAPGRSAGKQGLRWPFPSPIARLGALLLALSVVTAACGSATSTPTPTGRPSGGASSPTSSPTATRPAGTPVASPAATPGGTPSASPGTGGIQHPTGASELILLLDRSGGFVPYETLVTSMPLLALYGDGRLITHGPQIAIFPPPALPNLLVTRINEAGIQAILREAQAAGLLDGDKRYDYQRVADAEWTEFTTVANGRRSLVAAYALSIDVPGTDIPADQRQAREKLKEFQAKLLSAASWLPAGSIVERDVRYQIDRLQVVTAPISQTATPAPDPVQPQRVDWPLTTPLSQLGDPYGRPSPDTRCAVLQGADLTTVLQAMMRANRLTQWASAGDLYNVYPRPLLPHETGCVVRR